MTSRVEDTLSILVTVCAVTVAGTVVWKSSTGSVSESPGRPEYVEAWDQLLDSGRRLGPASAPVQIVEFGDFQCPFCRTFHQAVLNVMDKLPGQISLVYFHLPLSIHPHAVPAARAAECAAAEELFEPMAAELLAKQDSMGMKSWASFARSVGIAHTMSFLRCTEDPLTITQIEHHRVLAAELGIKATPTVMINGWRFQAPPTDSLALIAKEIINGRSKFVSR